ncbi:precorrin-8X methylmutase [Thermus tengchongensis]|uniref:Precorrin-8X methylmutase n=2 Tax=Thermus tengchongensis TaxID=1214928 RepID=A0A4Y9ET95_9DEIN|nr:precorrin-8X methylmutase [Thermus tengchongensis]TFU14284.1 precorrin-8X methylmutase [Thermus tengchongensis]TFU25066.1 precorrin-8X methylmutase [Thermus tengchongensis]
MDELVRKRQNPAHQLTPKGRAIEEESFRIVDEEAGPHGFSPWEWPIVRRMIHATADFEYKDLTRFRPGAVEAGLEALKGGARILVDARMIACGLNPERLRIFGNEVVELLSHPEVVARAQTTGGTRAETAVAYAEEKGLLQGAIVGVGNAPTFLLALVEAIRRGARPALVLGMPVGFVNVAEAKRALMEAPVPWIVTEGRKGGSTLVVAALHALIRLAADGGVDTSRTLRGG